MENSNQLTIVEAQEGKNLSVVGDTYRIVIGGKQTGGAYAVIDMLVPPKGGPGPHSHAAVQEAFYILEGEITIRTESQTYIAKKGAYVNIPLGGMIHQFKNLTDKMAHMLCIVTPAGMEDLFEEIGKPVQQGVLLPPQELGPDELKKFLKIAERHGQKLFPPDYLDK
jgi:quercetin dioxygenase-like cupin family protein